jgi:murein DD-endopeptidase MepM/ murein hydrolase activator NlpD
MIRLGRHWIANLWPFGDHACPPQRPVMLSASRNLRLAARIKISCWRAVPADEVLRPGSRCLCFVKAAFYATALMLAPAGSWAARSDLQATMGLLPPVASACISSPFGPRILPHRPLAGTFHEGIDLPAAVGTPVTAVAPGRIIRIQRRGVGGLEILIQHQGFIGVYSHLGLIAPVVAEGAKSIYSGERIATVGRSGLTYGPHLYFGMIINGRPVDPAPHLDVGSCGVAAPSGREALIRPTRLITKH